MILNAFVCCALWLECRLECRLCTTFTHRLIIHFPVCSRCIWRLQCAHRMTFISIWMRLKLVIRPSEGFRRCGEREMNHFTVGKQRKRRSEGREGSGDKCGNEVLGVWINDTEEHKFFCVYLINLSSFSAEKNELIYAVRTTEKLTEREKAIRTNVRIAIF